MCGICGFVHRGEDNQKTLETMIETIRYRGPDDVGFFEEKLENGFRLGFAHRRLAILDLSEKGHQPMCSDDGRLVLVFNGEIYNFLELRAELEGRGCFFRTGTDTEVILAAVQEWGTEKALPRFNGMFAFALFDRKEQSVTLVRDRMGVKPLYYTVSGDGLVFASELKPLMCYPGFQKEIDGDALQLYLSAEYIPGSRSIFRNTRKLLPGEMLKWTGDGVTHRRWWSVEQAFQDGEAYTGSYEEAREELNALLEDAVKLRMISDVPLGVFLSNGVDSSLIAAKMKKASASPIRTFTVAFREDGFDESGAAERVAAFLGAEHLSETLDADEGKKLLLKLPEFWDEPMADPSSVATMLVSRMARRNVTVALSGDAGDELFYGYNTYDHFERLRRWIPAGRLLNAADRILPVRDFAGEHNSRRLMKLLCLRSEEEIIDADLIAYRERYRTITEGSWDFSDFSTAMSSGKSLPEKAMLHDLITYLPGDILTKVDRASMASSLELRAPLLDYRVVEFALRLPLSYKYRDGVRKRILKDLLYREVPEELIGQRKKGFRIPFADWLRNDYRELLEDYCSESYLRRQNLFDIPTVRKMLGSFRRTETPDYAREVWTFLLFQMWYDRYIA